MITFPAADTIPLSKLDGEMFHNPGSILSEHYGFDPSLAGDWSACSRCGEKLATNEDVEKHAGDCNE
jgi:hypothetical protein